MQLLEQVLLDLLREPDDIQVDLALEHPCCRFSRGFGHGYEAILGQFL